MASRELTYANVTVSLSGVTHNGTVVKLSSLEIQVFKDNSLVSSIPLRSISAIEIHQPIFGSNYIDIEHGNHEKMVLTFKSGGATEFAQAFFRLTEGIGHVDTQQLTPSMDSGAAGEATIQVEDKKNK